MRIRRHAIGFLVASASLGTASAVTAQSPLDTTARLEGRYELTGRVTVARRVLGEHAGDTVHRIWTFFPLCPVGPCASVALRRERQAGSDTLVLQLIAPDYYVGTGTFYVPLRCGRRIIRKGESVPFTI